MEGQPLVAACRDTCVARCTPQGKPRGIEMPRHRNPSLNPELTGEVKACLLLRAPARQSEDHALGQVWERLDQKALVLALGKLGDAQAHERVVAHAQRTTG